MPEVKMLIGSIVASVRGKDPQPYYSFIGMEGETMGQLAARCIQYAEHNLGKNWQNYNGVTNSYNIYLGELSHQIAPPPPPKPVEVEVIKERPVAVPKRPAVTAKLKTVKLP